MVDRTISTVHQRKRINVEKLVSYLGGIYAVSNMDLFTALSLFSRQKYEACAAVCTDLLRKNPLDQVCLIIPFIQSNNYLLSINTTHVTLLHIGCMGLKDACSNVTSLRRRYRRRGGRYRRNLIGQLCDIVDAQTGDFLKESRY